MTYVITAGCIDVTDKTCIGECPVDCIYEGQRMLYINPDECIDCGACEPVCPAEAIYFEVDVPAPLLPFVGATARFVADVQASGGASNRGALEGDADLVAGWPAKTGE